MTTQPAAWIRIIHEDEAEGDLKARYDEMKEWYGVDNILKIHSLSPKTLDAHYLLYKTVMTPTKEVRKYCREMVAVIVSAINKCKY